MLSFANWGGSHYDLTVQRINHVEWMRVLIAVIVLGFIVRAVPGFTGERPNVLLIVSDDLGYPDLGCIGTKQILTPNLDRLAARGVRATSFYVTCPACTPSRASILTGRYPQRNGLYELVRNDMVNYGHIYTEEEYATSPEMTLGLDPREVTIGDVLKRVGYRTGVVGKWDMGQAKRFLPLQRGFDFFYGIGNNGIDYYTHERYGIPSMFRGNERTEQDKGTYATDLFRREAMEFIDKPSQSPWFLYLAFNAPHAASSYSADSPSKPTKSSNRPEGVGVQAPEQWVRPYRGKVASEKLARYYAAVTCMDAAIGEILGLIEKRGETTNTFVIFLSDNGGSGNGGNAPLKAGKGTMFEGGLRVPFIASLPGRLPQGKTTDEFLSTLELFPTIVGLGGAQLPGDLELDGFNMLPILAGAAPSPRKEMFWMWRGMKAARVGRWKWIESPRGGGLFNLIDNPGESADLSATFAERAADLKGRFAEWRKQMETAPPRGPFRNY